MPAAAKAKTPKPSPQPAAETPATPANIALVLQGGGALGAYQVGAFEALAEAGFQPNWVAGISIGAFNATIITGNEPAHRLDKLTAFWQNISWPDVPIPPKFLPLQILHNQFSNSEALTIGQPNFFSPRTISPYFLNSATPDALSFYDTSALRRTLPAFASFDLINNQTTRLFLGATNLATGRLEFFDSKTDKIAPEHTIASGSLPPGFPATKIKDSYYWDGGCVSNTPLEAIAAAHGQEDLLVFVIDLWDAAGTPPSSMNDVFWRAKQIQYAGRTQRDLHFVAALVNYAHTLNLAQAAGDATLPSTPPPPKGRLELVHIIYHPGPDHIPNSDAEFSRTSLAARREAGLADMRKALAAAPWKAPMPSFQQARIHTPS